MNKVSNRSFDEGRVQSLIALDAQLMQKLLRALVSVVLASNDGGWTHLRQRYGRTSQSALRRTVRSSGSAGSGQTSERVRVSQPMASLQPRSAEHSCAAKVSRTALLLLSGCRRAHRRSSRRVWNGATRAIVKRSYSCWLALVTANQAMSSYWATVKAYCDENLAREYHSNVPPAAHCPR